ncbi:hypothetical protein GCM10023065_31360 [Microbacterium laevaniformans]
MRVALVREANTIGGRHGLGMSDQSRTASSRQSPRIYEAPGMALLFIAYERLVNGILNEDTLATTTSRVAVSDASCTRGAGWSRSRSCCCESIQRWVGSAISGTVTLRLRRGEDYTILDTVSNNLSYAPEKLSMERVGDAAFGPTDRIGQLTMPTSTSPTRARVSSSTRVWD